MLVHQSNTGTSPHSVFPALAHCCGVVVLAVIAGYKPSSHGHAFLNWPGTASTPRQCGLADGRGPGSRDVDWQLCWQQFCSLCTCRCSRGAVRGGHAAAWAADTGHRSKGCAKVRAVMLHGENAGVGTICVRTPTAQHQSAQPLGNSLNKMGSIAGSVASSWGWHFARLASYCVTVNQGQVCTAEHPASGRSQPPLVQSHTHTQPHCHRFELIHCAAQWTFRRLDYMQSALSMPLSFPNGNSRHFCQGVPWRLSRLEGSPAQASNAICTASLCESKNDALCYTVPTQCSGCFFHRAALSHRTQASELLESDQENGRRWASCA